MNLINPGGLLWFDDDNRRSIQQKIAEAAQRYRERVGFEPTICQLNPAQATALETNANQASTRTKRASAAPAPTLPDTLRLVPSTLIQPHCYLVGIAEGDQPRAAVLPYRDDEETEAKGSARKTASARAAAGMGQVSAQRASAASRRAPARTARVHPAVQPTLIGEAPAGKATAKHSARTRTGRSATSSPTNSLSAAPASPPSLSTSKTATSVTRSPQSPRPKPAGPAAPTSLLAAAPKAPARATVSTRRARSAKPTTLSAPTLPLPELAATPQADKRRALTSRHAEGETPRSARRETRSGSRTTKRSA